MGIRDHPTAPRSPRAAHLAMILLVCAEALVGCAFTRLENVLRLRGGETGYTRDFIGYWLDRLIFYNAPVTSPGRASNRPTPAA